MPFACAVGWLFQAAEQILEGADTEDVAFLVVGDPFG